MFNSIFAVFFAVSAAPFTLNAEEDSAVAVSSLGSTTLSCTTVDADKADISDGTFAVTITFKARGSHSDSCLRPNHVLATFKTKNEARAFLRDLVSIQNARFNI